MGFRTRESINAEIAELEKHLTEIGYGAERNKTKARIRRLQNIFKERERDRIRRGIVAKEKKKEIENIEHYSKEVQEIILYERNKNKAQWQPDKKTKVIKDRRKKRVCSDCHKKAEHLYSNIEFVNECKNIMFCEECAKKYKDIFEV